MDDLSQRIRERAYQIWQTEPASSDLDNWLAAERELQQGSAPRMPSAAGKAKAKTSAKSRKGRAA